MNPANPATLSRQIAIRLVIFHPDENVALPWRKNLAEPDLELVRGNDIENTDSINRINWIKNDDCTEPMDRRGSSLIPSLHLPIATVLWFVEPFDSTDPRRLAAIREFDRKFDLELDQKLEDVWIGPMALEEVRWRLDRVRRRIREMETFQEMAIHDPLTRLLTRRAFMTMGESLVAATLRNRRLGTLVFCDIDQFKRINDTHGHMAGDRVLRIVADQFRERLRRSDLAARWGGDEFVLYLPETTPDQTMIPLARIRNRLRDNEIPITISAGVVPIPGESPAEDESEREAHQTTTASRTTTILTTAIRLADAAMYREKMEKSISGVQKYQPHLKL